MTIQSQCGALNYLSRWEEARAASTEGARIADEAGNEWWTAQMSAWRLLAELRLGNIETATRLLDEGLVVFSRLGDHRARSWSLLAKAMFTSMQGRSHEAIDLFKSVVESAKEIGYRRVIQTALQYLGEAHVGAGELEAAEAAFLEALAMSEQMGSVLEMAGTLSSVAQVRMEMGEKENAVAILASVLADPVSGRSTRLENVPVSEMATELLAELDQELDAETYAAAYARGRAKSLEVAVKELLAT
jgi:tetratricopeptide (TPR) repeat protein